MPVKKELIDSTMQMKSKTLLLKKEDGIKVSQGEKSHKT